VYKFYTNILKYIKLILCKEITEKPIIFCHSRVNGNPVFPSVIDHFVILVLAKGGKQESILFIHFVISVLTKEGKTGIQYFHFVIPVKTGIHSPHSKGQNLYAIPALANVFPISLSFPCKRESSLSIGNIDSCFRRNDSLDDFF